MNNTPVVFASNSYPWLAEEVCALSGWEPGKVVRRRFEDDAFGHRIETCVRARNVVVIGGTINANEREDIIRVAGGAVKEGAYSLTIVNPYMGTQRQERKRRDTPGEVVGAKQEAKAFSRLPRPALTPKILLADLHSPTIPSFFDDENVSAEEFYLEPVTAKAVAELGGDDFVLASTDLGGAKWVHSWAKRYGWKWAINVKIRDDDGVTGIGIVNAEVIPGRRIVFFDDMVNSGKTLVTAAGNFKAAGAGEIMAVFSHGPLPGDALQYVKSSGLISRMITTNTHPRARALADGVILEARSIAPVIISEVKAAWGWN